MTSKSKLPAATGDSLTVTKEVAGSARILPPPDIGADPSRLSAEAEKFRQLRIELLELTHFAPLLHDYYCACSAEYFTTMAKADFGSATDPAFKRMRTTMPFGDYQMPVDELNQRFLYVDDLVEQGVISPAGKSHMKSVVVHGLTDWHVKTMCRLMEKESNFPNRPRTLSLHYILDQLETDKGMTLIRELTGRRDYRLLPSIRTKVDKAWESYGRHVQEQFRNPLQHSRAEYYDSTTSESFTNLHGNEEGSEKYHSLTAELHAILSLISRTCFGIPDSRIPTGIDHWNNIWSGSTDIPWCFDLNMYPIKIPQVSDQQRFGDPSRFQDR